MKTEKKNEWVEAMAFSPCNNFLAIGSHNNFIYVFDCKKYSDKSKTKLSGHSSFITSLDWSQDSNYLRSNCGAYELLFFKNVNKKGTRDPSGASNTVSTIW